MERDQRRVHGGSVGRSTMSLFKASTGGESWGICYGLLEKVGWVPASAFILFLLFCFVAAWNVISSMFIERVLSLAQPDLEEQMLRKRRQDMIDAEELTSIIAQANTDGSGRLSMEEFVARLQDSKFRYFLEFRGLSNKDAMMYFKLLTSTTGESDVDIPTFAGGCLAMRGTASAMDMHAL